MRYEFISCLRTSKGDRKITFIENAIYHEISVIGDDRLCEKSFSIAVGNS